LFQTARTYFGLGQYNSAYQSFRKLTELYPESPMAKESMLQMGQCFYNAGDIPRSIDQYTAYLKKYPNDEKTGEVQELLQMAFYKQGKTGADLKDVAAQFPRSKFTADIYWELGAEAFNRKDYDKALGYFERLIMDFPNSSQSLQAYYYKSDSYFLKGEYANAVTNFKNFLVNYPQDTLAKDARFKLAVSYFSLKDYTEAAVAFHDFIESHPADPKARDAALNIPVCYAKAHQPFQGVGAYLEFLRRYPSDPKVPNVYLQMGQLYEEGEDYVKAVESYKKIPSDQEEIYEALFSLGRCYKKLKTPTEEKAAYEALGALTPRDNKFRLAGLVLLGEALESDGAVEKAIAVYQDIASHSTNPEWRAVAQERISALKGGK
jgi:TolA-binding protein